jgi:hypothetical protein
MELDSTVLCQSSAFFTGMVLDASRGAAGSLRAC